MNKRNWFITGASSGLGKSLLEEVIAKGDFAIVSLRKESEVEEFNSNYHNKAIAVQMDLTNYESIDRAVSIIMEKFGTPEVLVNNAGSGFVGAIEESSIAEIKVLFEVNFFGTMYLTQKFLKPFRENRSGTIIQISSHAGIKSFPGFGVYNASKYALEGVSEALYDEVKHLGIKVLIVEPGPFRTGFAGKGLIESKEVIDDYESSSGAFRKKLKSVNGKQEGDPRKAASAIYEFANAEKSNLRLMLGKTPLITVDMKIKSLEKDLEASRNIAEKCVYDNE